MAWTTLPKPKSMKNAEKREKAKEKRKVQREHNEKAQKLQAVHTQVLSTTELLEMILLHLLMKDLLLAQRVSVKWKAVIDESPDLQNALFFRPATSHVAFLHTVVGMDTEHCLQNGSWGDYFDLCPPNAAHLEAVERIEKCRIKISGSATTTMSSLMPGEAQMKRDRETPRGVVSRTQVVLKPLVFHTFHWFTYIFSSSYKYDFEVMTKGNKFLRLPRSAKRPEASWRRMLVTQPPLAVLTARKSSKYCLELHRRTRSE